MPGVIPTTAPLGVACKLQPSLLIGAHATCANIIPKIAGVFCGGKLRMCPSGEVCLVCLIQFPGCNRRKIFLHSDSM